MLLNIIKKQDTFNLSYYSNTIAKFYIISLIILSAFMSSLVNVQASIPSLSESGVPTLAPLMKSVTPSIVNISTRGTIEVRRNTRNPLYDHPLFRDPLFEKFFNIPELPTEQEHRSIGSGVIIDSANGYIVTNNHVIQDADEIIVNLLDMRRFKAHIIGRDEETDIAILQIKNHGDDLSALPFASTSSLQVGDFVVAIGNPFGLGHTVTSGIVSALGRSGLGIEGYEDFIQTDASINPGNSGGALVDLHGNLVGINTAVISRSGENVGIGFAIPSSMVQAVVNQLIEHGEVRRGQLGVHIQDLTPDIAQLMGMNSTDTGALVANVTKNSPAEKAGIQPGDIIIKINNRAVSSASDLRNRVGLLQVGEKVRLKIIRQGKSGVFVVTIGSRDNFRNSAEGFENIPILEGVDFEEISTEDGKATVRVSSVERNSIAWNAGIQEGDVIVSLNNSKVNNIKDMLDIMKNNKQAFPPVRLLFFINRDERSIFILLQ